MLSGFVFPRWRNVPKRRSFSQLIIIPCALLLLPASVLPDRSATDVVLRRCCSSGLDACRAKNSSSPEILAATFALVRSVPWDQQAACRSSTELCCLHEQRTQQCSDGTQAALSGKDCNNALFSETQKDCCLACKLGRAAKLLGSSCSASAVFPSMSGALETPFSDCCKGVPITIGNSSSTTPASASTTQASSRNLCDTLSPDLCAHRCVPTAGSYRCECEPGFKLMEDGKSCTLISHTDRCVKNNPCEHLCTDTGLAVECSCRKGYRLDLDGTSCSDVDECSIGTHLCDSAVSFCRNKKGGYSCVDRITGKDVPIGTEGAPASSGSFGNVTRCPLGFAYNAEASACDDIDECLLDDNVCRGSGPCKNTIGSFVCFNSTIGTCPPGYDRAEGSTVCMDIDECARHTDACDRSTHFCLNTQGGFECLPRGSAGGGGRGAGGISLRGGCPAGFKADPAQRGNCIDVDECSENIHGCSITEVCRNTQGAYDCEPRCPIGFYLDSELSVCRDIDECSARSNNSLCNPNERCVNTPGSYLCIPRAHGTCPPGYRPASTPGLCNDIDECSEKLHKCSAGTICINELGSHRCEQRGQLSSPENTTSHPGRGSPVCSPGFEYDAPKEECVDADECASGAHSCSLSERCVNTQGSFSCSPMCEPGFRPLPDQAACEDIDECSEGTHTCRYSSHVCRNTNGSFICECRAGYRRGKSGNCEDVDECLFSPCSPRQSCLNSIGSYRCVPPIPAPVSTKQPLIRLIPIGATPPKWCPAGYQFSTDENKCIDIDECEQNANLCNVRTEVCVNVKGAYRCDPKSSALMSRTESSTLSSMNDTLSTQPDSSTENSEKPATSTSTPSSTTEDTTQKCFKGYQYSAIRRRCVDIDECTTLHPCGRSSTCRNTPGSFVCDGECKSGFKRDPITHSCIDINECQIGTSECLEWQRCDNTIGSYTCVRMTSCGTGYTLNAETGKCEDDNECDLGTHFCGSGRVCRNTLGSFRCEATAAPVCGPGFIANTSSRKCVDVDECENSPCRPGHNCINTVGSYQCELALVCGPGYQQNDSGDDCVDVDECSMGSHECKPGQRCINRPGGYQCLCPAGHRMSDGVCKDVDECEALKGQVCPPMATCKNVVGSYQCVCHNGYKNVDFEGGHGCTDVDECSETPSICHQRCINTPGSYRCACNAGYTLAADNRTCDDINECELYKDHKRLCLGHCVNLPGNFTCRCPQGYRLGADGRTCQDINECNAPEGNPCHSPEEDCFNVRGSYRCNSLRCPPGYKRDETHKNRCTLQPCEDNNISCKLLPWTVTTAFVTWTSKYPIPSTGHFDFFTLRMPNYSSTRPRYTLKLENVIAGQDVLKATQDDFVLRNESPTRKIVSLLKPLKGPQDIELHLTVDFYSDRNLFISAALHKILIVVSANEF